MLANQRVTERLHAYQFYRYSFKYLTNLSRLIFSRLNNKNKGLFENFFKKRLSQQFHSAKRADKAAYKQIPPVNQYEKQNFKGK